MSVPVYRIESSISEEEYSEPQLPLFPPRYVIESSSSEEEVRPQPRRNLFPPREHYLPRYEIESSTSEEAIDMPREGVNEILRGEVERVERIPYRIFDHMGEPVAEPPLGGPLGDDSYVYEAEEGSVEMHCSLLFKFLAEMVRKVFHLTLIFLNRNEEMAICFANTLFMAGINCEVERDPAAEAQVALFHLRAECPDGSVHEVTEAMGLDGMNDFIKHIESHPAAQR